MLIARLSVESFNLKHIICTKSLCLNLFKEIDKNINDFSTQPGEGPPHK